MTKPLQKLVHLFAIAFVLSGCEDQAEETKELPPINVAALVADLSEEGYEAKAIDPERFKTDLERLNMKGAVKEVWIGFEILEETKKKYFNQSRNRNKYANDFLKKIDLTGYLYYNQMIGLDYRQQFLHYLSFDANGFATSVGKALAVDSLEPYQHRDFYELENGLTDVIRHPAGIDQNTLNEKLSRVDLYQTRVFKSDMRRSDNQYHQAEIHNYAVGQGGEIHHRFYALSDTLPIDYQNYEENEEDLKFILVYSFFDDGRIRQLDLYHPDQNYDPYDYSTRGAFFSRKTYFPDISVRYGYTDSDMPENLMVVRDGSFVKQESFEYDGQRISAIENIGKRGHFPKMSGSYKSRYTLNEMGDLTKVDYYDLDLGRDIVETHIYDYTYDSSDNWTECVIYVEGDAETPSAKLTREIDYH